MKHLALLGLLALPALGSSIDKEAIRRVIKAHVGHIRRCYEQELKDHAIDGKLVVSFTVNARGAVEVAEVKSSTFASPRLEVCVLDEVRTWRFGAGPGSFTIVYPFVFKAG